MLLCNCFHGFAQTILFEDFTSVAAPALPTGWTNTFTAVPGTTPQGWITTTETADYFFSYATPPHTQYVECTEVYETGNDPANLTSPSFSLAAATAPYLSFDYLFEGTHYYTGGVGYFEEMYIQLSTDGGTTWNNIDTLPTGGYWDSRFINLAAYAGSPNCMLNFRYTDSSGILYGALLTNVRVFNMEAVDIALTSISPMAGSANLVPTTTGITFGGAITNFGSTTINSFSATYQVGSAAPVTSSFSGLSIAPLTSYSFTCTTPYLPATLDTFPVAMWVTETDDTVFSNDTMSTNIRAISHYPVKKLVAEEATATWCDTCPYGIIGMDSAEHLVHDSMSFIAIHCSLSTPDPMTEPDYYSFWMQGQIPQYPYLLLDRRIKTTPDDVDGLYIAHTHDFGYADMYIGAIVSGSSVSVPVSINPATNLQGNFRLALVLTEDSVHSNVTPGDWDQNNTYSGGGSGPLADGEYDFVTLPDPVPATIMYYDHVSRSIYPSVDGGSYLPATMNGGTTYSYTFTVPLNTSWTVSHMHAIVMLIDSVTGYILNSDNIWLTPHSITPPLSVTVTETRNISIYPAPASSTLTVSADDPINQIAIGNLLGETIYNINCNAKTVQVRSFPGGSICVVTK